MNMKRCLTALLIIGGAAIAPPTLGETPRGIGNNNPFNIEETHETWKGQIACPDLRFVCFSHVRYSIRAATFVLHSYHHRHGIVHLSDVMARWAPHHENPTEAVYAFVSNELRGSGRVGPNNLYRLLEAIIHIENGIQPYSREMIRREVRNALEERESNLVWFVID